jgi:hypothetical protein
MGFIVQLHAPAALLPGNNPSTYLTGDWVGPRASLELFENKNLGDSNPRSSSPYNYDPFNGYLVFIYGSGWQSALWNTVNKYIIIYESVNAANMSFGPSHHKMVVLSVCVIKKTLVWMQNSYFVGGSEPYIPHSSVSQTYVIKVSSINSIASGK